MALAYFVLAYFTLRTDYGQVLGLYAILFGGFLYLFYYSKLEFKQLTQLSVLFRVIFIVAIPNLSNDFYRFIWDGRVLLQGFNPYLYTPKEFMLLYEEVDQGELLVRGMGDLNASHYSPYPPLNQLGFFIPALLFSKSLLGSTIVMRLLIALADLGTFWIGAKLLKHLNLNPRNIILYILNPYIIIEMTGNLHWEGVMVFFMLWALYLLIVNKWMTSALVLSLSVSIKLMPLIFSPLFFRRLKFSKSAIYYLLVLLGFLILFLPFLSPQLVANFSRSLGLYFQNFEFNASIYYVIRAIGFEVTGYNIIQSVGKVLPFITLGGVLLLTFVRKNEKSETLIVSMMLAISIYYALSTTVHPWYIAVPLGLSVFTRYRYPLVWSGTLILSYSAYAAAEYQENLALIALEYGLVYGYLVYELVWVKSKKPGRVEPDFLDR